MHGQELLFTYQGLMRRRREFGMLWTVEGPLPPGVGRVVVRKGGGP